MSIVPPETASIPDRACAADDRRPVRTCRPSVLAADAEADKGKEQDRGSPRNPRSPRRTSAAPAPAAAGQARTCGAREGPHAVLDLGTQTPTAATSSRSRFPAARKSARLKAACDNRMTLFLNGQKVAEGDELE